MALTDEEKQMFQRGIANDAAYEELVAIIVAGTQPNTLTDYTKIALDNALGLNRVTATVVAAFEGGSALNDESKLALRRLMGRDPEGDNLITEIGAIA